MELDLADLKQELLQAFRSGEIELPSMPELLFQIRKALYSGKSAAQIGRMIQLDAALSTSLMKVANSALYMGLNSVNSPQGAITRLGLAATRNLVTSIVLKNAYRAKKSPHLALMIKQSWQQSCRIGAISQVLATFAMGVRADQAMLGGVLHNIGVLPLFNYLQGRPTLAANAELVQQLSNSLSGKLGTMLLKHWQFDEEFVVIPELCKNLNYVTPQDRLTIAEVVVVAKMHARLTTEKRPQVLEELLSIPAYKKMNLSHFGLDASLEVLDQAKDEISNLMQALQ